MTVTTDVTPPRGEDISNMSNGSDASMVNGNGSENDVGGGKRREREKQQVFEVGNPTQTQSKQISQPLFFVILVLASCFR